MARKKLKTLNAELTDNFTSPEYLEEHEKLKPEFEVVRAMLDARKEAGLTQKQLAELMGKPQSTVARLESGTHNPKIGTLHDVAKALGKDLKISFV